MQKFQNDRFQESYYTHTLDNGLKVILIHKPEYSSSFASLTTPFGAFDLQEKLADGTEVDIKPGLAHFLEHKLFESEEKDILSVFTEMGFNANAGTGYDQTTYYFSGPRDIQKPLELLLDFVQSLTITDASVEKEKGIIIQELMMYEQMPDFKLLMETFKAMYHVHPLRYDIGGSPDSVRSITTQDLYDAYALNYHPQNMILVVVSPQDPYDILEIIRTNQNRKTFPPLAHVRRVESDEPDTILTPLQTIHSSVAQSKTMIGYKQPVLEETEIARFKRRHAIAWVLDMNFSSLNPHYQNWLDDGLLNDYFGYEYNADIDYGYLLFVSETNQPEALITLVEAQLREPILNQDLLDQLKKRELGRRIRMFQDFDWLASEFVHRYFQSIDLFAAIGYLEEISLADCRAAIASLTLEQRVIVNMEKQ